MEILHVIPAKAGAVLEFLRALEKSENMAEHKVLALVPRLTAIKSVPEMLAFPYIEYIQLKQGRFSAWRNERSLKRRLEQADLIVWHGLSMGGGRAVTVLYRNPELCRKSAWIEDGIDPESWMLEGNDRNKERINRMNREVRARIPYVGVPFGADISYIRRLWPDKKVFLTPYPLSPDLVGGLNKVFEERAPREFPKTEQWVAEHEEKYFFPWLDIDPAVYREEEAEAAKLEEEAAEVRLEEAAEAARMAQIALAAKLAKEAVDASLAEATQQPQAEESAEDEDSAASGDDGADSASVEETAAPEQTGEDDGPDETEAWEADENERIPHIQIGLNSQTLNHHKLCIDAVKSYCPAPIKVFLPMNYTIKKMSLDAGPKVYRNKTIAGTAPFRGKFSVLSKQADMESFLEYLSRLDVAVLGNSTSIASQYMLMLIKAGVKLYLPQKSYVFQYLKKLGYPVGETESVGSQSMGDFLASEKQNLPEELELYFDAARVMGLWRSMFEGSQEKR